MKRFLIVGCGAVDKNKSFDSLKYGLNHTDLHPKNEFDTMDIDPEYSPTFLQDLSETDVIRKKFVPNSYALIVLERIPSELIKDNSAKSVAHLVEQKGLIALLPTGGPALYLQNMLAVMRESDFETCIISPGAQLMLFFKSDNIEQSLEIVHQFIKDVPYVKNLFTNQDKSLMRSFSKEQILTPYTLNQYAWSIKALE